MMPKVYNKHHNDAPDDAVYIGRPGPWGNPFSHLRSDISIWVATREDALIKFRDFVERNPWFQKKIRDELKGKDLVCYCAPKACHGDILIEFANKEE